MRSIQLPQAITSMLPVLISQLVVVLKDTAIGYQITFLEMVRQGTQVGAAYGNYIPALMVIAVLMITVNFLLSAAATRLERRLRRSRRAPRPLDAAAIEQEGAPGASVIRLTESPVRMGSELDVTCVMLPNSFSKTPSPPISCATCLDSDIATPCLPGAPGFPMRCVRSGA